MAGLYVDFAAETVSTPPRDSVRLEQATSLLNLAKASLAVSEAKGVTAPEAGGEELQWFLTAAEGDIGRRRLFSPPFLKKHEELGDTREWVRWARGEFEKIAEAEKEHLQRELARQASEPGKAKPKWLMKVRVQTASHSLRQKTLNYWNDRINHVKLRTAGPKNEDLLLEITLHDHIPLGEVFDAGMMVSKMHIVMLNVGTCGFFWYELTSQGERYFESVKDLDSPSMDLVIAKRSGLSKEWVENREGGATRRHVALEEAHLNIAIMALAAFLPMPPEKAEPIFGPTLKGLRS